MDITDDSTRDELLGRYKKLVFAVVVHAVREHHSNLKKHGIEVAEELEAGQWLRSKNTSPFTCQWCCDMVDIDYVRLMKDLNSGAFVRALRVFKSHIMAFEGERDDG